MRPYVGVYRLLLPLLLLAAVAEVVIVVVAVEESSFRLLKEEGVSRELASDRKVVVTVTIVSSSLPLLLQLFSNLRSALFAFKEKCI